MSINGWYQGNPDNVTDDDNVDGWDDQSTEGYGSQIAGGFSYRFGPVINHFGTWGQLIYSEQDDLMGQDLANPSGLDGQMPDNPGPDGSEWVQGHLLNGECGGDGSIDANLTPITHNINMWHKGCEGVLQLLVQRGAAGNMVQYFNPNNISNSRLIYRTHALPPPAGAFAIIPSGLCVSIGIVIDGMMKSLYDVQNEFDNNVNINARWFANRYYGNDGANHRQKILEMVGGTSVVYPT